MVIPFLQAIVNIAKKNNDLQFMTFDWKTHWTSSYHTPTTTDLQRQLSWIILALSLV